MQQLAISPQNSITASPRYEKKTNKKNDLINALIQLQFSKAYSEDIAEKWATGWSRCGETVDFDEEQLVLSRQLHKTKGLKVACTDAGWIGDIGGRTLGQGGNKRAKLMIRIMPSGDLIPCVRYTEKNDLPRANARAIFRRECTLESEVRIILEDCGERIQGELSNENLYSNILPLEVITAHVSHDETKGLRIKTRYVTELASVAVTDFFVDKSKHLLPKEERATHRNEALHACLGAVRGLRFLHARGFVHLDVKPDNIVIVKGIGKLADLGLIRGVKAPFTPCGTKGYAPPEYFREMPPEHNVPSMDMYEFGVTLSFVADYEDLGTKLSEINYILEKGFLSYEDACSRIRQIQKAFRERSDGLSNLIAALIDPNPSLRPDSTETERVLEKVLTTLISAESQNVLTSTASAPTAVT